MGGGGGYFGSSSFNPSTFVERLREKEGKEAEAAQFDSQVGDYLNQKLSQFNDRDTEGIQRELDKILAGIGKEIEGSVSLLFGGSVAKHTYVDGMSDVDALVVIPSRDANNVTPRELISQLADRLRTHYGAANVRAGDLAVTVKTDGPEIQLLPAIRQGKNAFRISNGKGNGWLKINPKTFASALTKANREMNGKLVPTIKLAKAIIATLPEQRRVTGYHTEALAVDIFGIYEGAKTTKAMVMHFFQAAGERVRRPIPDTTGQSRHVDSYLGKTDSIERRVVADALSRVGRQLQNADGAQSLTPWKKLLE